jgi:hypothetical protein
MGADDDVGAHCTRRHDGAQRDDLGEDRDEQRAMGLRLRRDRRQIAQIAEDVRVLDDDAGGLVVDLREDVLIGRDVRRHRDDVVAGHLRDRADDVAIMRMQAAREHGLAAPGDAMGHQDRLGGAGRAVIHGGVGDLHLGERRDLRLELEQILQRALRDFRLVGRVACQEFRALDQVIHGRGNMVLVGARTHEERHGRGRDVAAGHAAQDALDLELALGAGQIEWRGQQLAAGHVAEQRVDIGNTDPREHVLAVGIGQREVAHGFGSVGAGCHPVRAAACNAAAQTRDRETGRRLVRKVVPQLRSSTDVPQRARDGPGVRAS